MADYSQYIQPEAWPVAPHLIGWTFTNPVAVKGQIDRVTIYGAESHNGAWAVGRHALVNVPTDVAFEVGNAIDAYCEACRKLIG